MSVQHVYTLGDLPLETVDKLLDSAQSLRHERLGQQLRGKTLICLFLSPSLRTRVSMELAARQLGAEVVVLQSGASLWEFAIEEGEPMLGNAAEHIKEASRVLARYADALAVRAFPLKKSWREDAQDKVLNGFMKWTGKPILNLESSLYHPCQGLADLLTMRDLSEATSNRKVVLTWTPHPKALPVAVPNSFAIAAAHQGWDLTITHPEGYELPSSVLTKCRELAASRGQSVTVEHDRDKALEGAQFVYAKSWGRLDRYGELDKELAERKLSNASSWIVDEASMKRTDNAYFMHCLPVRRGVVVADSVIDSERSLVFEQAENRLHVQKALLHFMMSEGD